MGIFGDRIIPLLLQTLLFCSKSGKCMFSLTSVIRKSSDFMYLHCNFLLSQEYETVKLSLKRPNAEHLDYTVGLYLQLQASVDGSRLKRKLWNFKE